MTHVQQSSLCSHISDIKQHFLFLLEELTIENIKMGLDILYGRDKITEDFMEKVNNLNTRKEKVRMFLLKLLRLKATDYDAFVEAIVKSDPCKIYVKETLHDQTPKIAVFKCELTKEQIVENMVKNRRFLKSEIDEPETIADFFTVFDDQSASLQENIVSEKHRKNKVKEIIKFVNKRLPERYCIFLTALKEMNNTDVFDKMNQPWMLNCRQGADIERAETVEQHNRPCLVCRKKEMDSGRLTELVAGSDEVEIHITFEHNSLHKIILKSLLEKEFDLTLKLMKGGVLVKEIKKDQLFYA